MDKEITHELTRAIIVGRGSSYNMGTQAEAFILQLVTVLLLGIGTYSQQCPLPSQSEISTNLRMYLISAGGESCCQAVAARDMYRSLSVAVQYTTTDSGVTSAVQYAQFQLECVTGSLK